MTDKKEWGGKRPNQTGRPPARPGVRRVGFHCMVDPATRDLIKQYGQAKKLSVGQVVEFSWPNFIHKPDMEPKLRKPGQTIESKRLNDKLSDSLIEILKPHSIIGLNKLRLKLEEATDEQIHPDKLRNLIKKSRNISELKTQKGKENIYSYTE